MRAVNFNIYVALNFYWYSKRCLPFLIHFIIFDNTFCLDIFITIAAQQNSVFNVDCYSSRKTFSEL
jgi:hypothetical protein